MGLKGNFPRGIKNCTSLMQLNLSHNHLSGPIPWDISGLLYFATSLDLSNNNFSGQVPESLANCSFLNILGLDHNRLTGALPAQLGMLNRIKIFRVNNNLLSGPIPPFSYSYYITGESLANNKGLCGFPLESCDNNKRISYVHSCKVPFGIGYALSFIAVFVSCCVPWVEIKMETRWIVFSLLEKRNKRKQAHHNLIKFGAEKQFGRFERTINKMSFTELSKATDNFGLDNVIGFGKMGTMYKAKLSNGWFLAVKKLHHDSEQSEKQFISELLALSRLRHVNLIPLLGFCIQNNEKLLVYKYMSNGNLYNWLHPVADANKILEWPLRVKIAIGVARGLACLHHNTKFRIVHRSLSLNCILLDRYFEPNISNFGDAIISNRGGVMFLCSSDSESGQFVNSGLWESDFVKKDVYDYGVVLVELITGKEPITTGSSNSLHKTLVEWIDHVSTSSFIFNDAIDKYLIGQGFDEEIIQFLKIASDCVQPYPFQRSTMLEVYRRLGTIGQKYDITCDSGFLI
ncbi:probably inactive leucine-rich repeat receptor-like protein kinase At5g48380 [Rosa chinensis]|uniref:probably inactive leucine-rich repeat receptor-like protein kinase At5g48380 n=1 Tax=Rosa chinensis TaxID=74649 RepID=UPI000D08CFF9|nr:probably inactive leucine-rich repeat receptor-like protein kinase At5g48380 [Rosa chinensis]